MEKENRKSLTSRFTLAQYYEVRKAAEKCGQSMGEFMREATINKAKKCK